MKQFLSAIFFSVAILAIVVGGCSKETETFESATLQDYFPMAVGKVFTYRLDSIVPTAFGTALTTRYYLAKDSVESQFNDNAGRPSFRIFRFITDTLAAQPYRFAATYVATVDNNTKQVEYVDNNLRFIKLHLPIKEGFTWRAHGFIDTKSINSTVSYLDEWEYDYRNVGENYTVRNKTYNNCVTVSQRDETNPPGPFNPGNYQQRNFGEEVYAKGIGLVYKSFLHWTWQITPITGYESSSFGIKLALIDYK